MTTTLIKNADYILTVDRERRIIENGAIVIVDKKIFEVGKHDDIAHRYPAARIIDARGKLVMPGLVDTHVHAAQQLGRGVGDEMYSMERYMRVLWGYEAGLDSDAALCGFRLCMLELLRAGITCFADPGNYFPAEEARAVRESGIRGLIARTALDIGQTAWGTSPSGFSESSEAALAESTAAISEFNGSADGRLKMWYLCGYPWPVPINSYFEWLRWLRSTTSELSGTHVRRRRKLSRHTESMERATLPGSRSLEF